MTSPIPPSGSIAGSVLPIRRAEELISTLQGVLSVRIVPNETGAIEEIHVLTTDAVLPKQTVRNIESALMAQLGLRVNHRKISIATTLDSARAVDLPPSPSAAAPVPPTLTPASTPPATGMAGGAGAQTGFAAPSPAAFGAPAGAGAEAPAIGVPRTGAVFGAADLSRAAQAAVATPPAGAPAGARASDAMTTGTPRSSGEARRVLIFEDVEVRRSRSRGLLCRVTLRRGHEEFIGEAEGAENERARLELAARAAVFAIIESVRSLGSAERSLALEGSKLIDAFDRQFIFVSVMARIGRETVALTGSCEVRESPETSAVLAVLDATNRWMHLDR